MWHPESNIQNYCRKCGPLSLKYCRKCGPVGNVGRHRFFKCFEYQELYIPFYKCLQGQIIKDIFHVGMLRKLERAIIGTCTLYDSTFGSLVEVYLWNLHIMSWDTINFCW